MHTTPLFFTIGNFVVDDVLAHMVGAYEKDFPGRIRGYYLLGSYADGRAVVGSDIDMYILFKDAFLSTEESAQAQHLAQACAAISILRLEIKLNSELALENEQSIMRIALKNSSILLFGTDTRASMALPTRAAYTLDATDGVLDFLFRLHPVDIIAYPLTYPDEQGFFYGYDNVTPLSSAVAAVYLDARTAASATYATRELVECVCRMATALLAIKNGPFVGTKRESVEVYSSIINDEWNNFLRAMFEKGKMRWAYTVPTKEEERAELHNLCARTLVFENHYLQQYRSYLLSLLRSTHEQHKQLALQRLKRVSYDDEEIISAACYTS